MLFGMLAEVLEFVLQFDDRFLEIELMFHAWEILMFFQPESMRIPAVRAAIAMVRQKTSIDIKRKAGLASGLSW